MGINLEIKTSGQGGVGLQTSAVWNDESQLAEQWARVRARLQAEVGEVEYRTWLKQVSFAGLAGDEVVVMLPTRFLRDWVNKEYGELIASFWQQENQLVKRVEFRTGAPASRPAAPDLAEPVQAPSAGQPAMVAPRQENMAALDQRFTFETFVVGKPNEFAYACARRVAEAPATAGFNPLFLYGGVGLGKTHLMHAIAWELSTNARGGRPVSVAYMSAEKFMYRFINALRSQSTLEFKNELRSVDVLMIDDLQFLIGKDNTQEEFFHTFNALVDAGKQIVISADKSPSDLSGLEDRLRTRLGCGMVADLHATTFELRYSILEAKAQRAGVEVPPKVLEFLARKITSNNRELEGALNRLVAHANLFNRQVTIDTAHEVLHDVLKAHDRKISIQEIQKRVCEHYNIRIAEMSSARRARNIARPRQVAMYLAKQLTSKSLPDIGRHFGNRDHTTVMHAVSRVTELIAQDAAFAEDVELLKRLLEN
ncbi:chromosomal replication initiator protein DnaA [Acidocella aminolytica]|jgi:chromosomal replication initiator protein|uniref:Chromosomal replication initiator protein DnaA n=1 Tax=Acidocella aminolytica 101 = DSM 11237 TaxID=1120923 RepID=A0A0D6PH61_9PROT|nr:chromosomal replication initiator protein DnaA [Acidocella aminolytica]GAN81012.1 chromosomal replication initiator protein DnaA [Acidocella aminolytica 101 = DSM 11237]GBQ41886.1 chromosome replication initiator DnaA [Acidocella aminolytica 101 = DSM 11237]SHE88740.1 chromosomal replication initiator protein [Acidocella aminolytica 101 = DSM 11237]